MKKVTRYFTVVSVVVLLIGIAGSPLAQLRMQSMHSVAGGRAASIRNMHAGVTAGTNSITAAVDQPGSATGRLQPSTKVLQQIKKLPDLVISRFSLPPGAVHTGSRVAFDVEVKNNGFDDLAGVILRLVNRQLRRVVAEQRLNLTAGRTTTAKIRLVLTGSGQVVMQAQIDPDRRITESNENNNLKQLTVRMASSARQASALTAPVQGVVTDSAKTRPSARKTARSAPMSRRRLLPVAGATLFPRRKVVAGQQPGRTAGLKLPLLRGAGPARAQDLGNMVQAAKPFTKSLRMGSRLPAH